MPITLIKKNLLFIAAVLIIAVSFLFVACQKELSASGGSIDQPSNGTVDLSTKINTSVDGFVTDENGIAVESALLQAGAATTSTDKFGYFKFTNVLLVKNAAMVTVTKPGYFNGIKTFIAKEGHDAFFRIKLLPKNTEGSISASSGGAVTLADGLSVSLPSDAVVVAGNNTAYSGTVNLAVKWLNPVAADLNQIMPGDLRGINSGGSVKLLQTYGMAAVELTGDGGEKLQIAAGKKATITFPLPNNLLSTAPANIPLWYFDESIGLWKEEGSAIKSGNSYVGEVSHFSYWNCDVPADNYVNLSGTVVNGKGEPVPYAYISVHYSNDTSAVIHGYTDAAGYFSGPVPANAQITVEIITDSYCGIPPYSQELVTVSSSIDLGDISITTTNIATITGILLNCNNQPVTDGFLIVNNSYVSYRVNLKSDGSFSYPMTFCTNTPTINFIAVDNATQKESSPQTHILIAGDNNLGNLNTCIVSGEQFVNYKVNGVDYALTWPTDSIIHASWIHNQINIQANSVGFPRADSVSFSFTNDGIAPNSVQSLNLFQSAKINEFFTTSTMQGTIDVNITEYGAIGEFIAGNFAGTFTGAAPAYTPYNISCNFRVRRTR